MLCAAAMVAMIAVIVSAGDRGDDTTSPGRLIGGHVLDMVGFDSPFGADRPIFKHSVVPGGVYTPDELRNVLVQDAVVATHYQKFNPDEARAETVKQDRFAYVSYRKNDQIFWTRNKVKLNEGETILTDGANEIRARCGNCISETPQYPVAEVEPASAEFDQFVDSGNRSLSAAIRSALESQWFGTGQGSGRPGAAGGGPATGATPSGSESAGLMASASPGGVGGSSRPASLASGGMSPDGPAGSAGGGAGKHADSPSATDAASEDASSGEASRPSISDAPGTPLSASAPGAAAAGPPTGAWAPDAPGSPFSPANPFASGSPGGNPLTSSSPGGPLTSGSPGAGGPTSGAPSSDRASLPPLATASVPAGIDPPPGFDPAAGVDPAAARFDPSVAGLAQESRDEPAAASIPEPGMLLLFGAGAGIAVLRKLRSRT